MTPSFQAPAISAFLLAGVGVLVLLSCAIPALEGWAGWAMFAACSFGACVVGHWVGRWVGWLIGELIRGGVEGFREGVAEARSEREAKSPDLNRS